jgi:Domain of unknown function (DUF4338)
MTKEYHTGRSESLKAATIVPSFRGIYLERFLHLVEGLNDFGFKRQREAIKEELAWSVARGSESLDQLRYKATLMVMNDLVGQGWRVQYRQRSIFLGRPDYTRGRLSQLDPATVKAQIRNSMLEERLAKIALPATVKFIQLMERPNQRGRRISDLIGDGVRLAQDLQSLSPGAGVDEVRSVVSPYLQIVEGEARDEHSGFRLIDIWRYFRYSWAIPYVSTPGRNLYYLVRDRAQPSHPVIGIAALGNSIVQLAERDRFIGWSLDGLADRLKRKSRSDNSSSNSDRSGPIVRHLEFLESQNAYDERIETEARRIADCLSEAIETELLAISTKNLVNEKDFDEPTEETISRLLKVAAASEHQRREELKSFEPDETIPRGASTTRSLSLDSETALFRRKRAQSLADLLFAKREFRREQLHANPLACLQKMMQKETGRKALRTALHANKKSKIGTSIMDIIVCGAIPPYGELLGGKLVAMLMASPQVLRDYKKRYGNHPSEISSKVAARPIIRPAELVFLGTTSLYHVGSSQYERISVPTPSGSTIKYERLGYTEGYGSTALSGETGALLRELVYRSEGMRRVNNIFGEGVSPRLRMVRDGLVAVGIPQEIVLRHSCPRIIYGIRLAANALEYLRGEVDVPQYYFSWSSPDDGTLTIVDHWITRWLRPRSLRHETLARLRSFDMTSLMLSKELSRLTSSGSQEEQEIESAS